MTDREIEGYFGFLTRSGYVFERDYTKGTDSTCTQIYRFKKDGANWIEFRVLSERERSAVVCARGEKRFPAIEKRHAAFLRRWGMKRLFSKERKNIWLRLACACREELKNTGTLFGLEVKEGHGE